MVSGNSLTNSSIQQTWMYLAGPVLLYAGERILRALRAGYYTVTVVKVSLTYAPVKFKAHYKFKCLMLLSSIQLEILIHSNVFECRLLFILGMY